MNTKSATQQHSWLRAVMTALLVILVAGQLPGRTVLADSIDVAKVTISLVRESSIPARDAGVLAELRIKAGDTVRQNDVIAVLENNQQEIAVRGAELALKIAGMKAEDQSPVESAMAQLREAESGRMVKEVALKIAEVEAESEVPIRIAAAETRMRKLELERSETARSSFKGSISESELDRLRTAVQKGELETQQAENDRAVQQLKPDAERAALKQMDEEIRRYSSLVNQEQKNLIIAKVNQDAKANELALAELQLEHRNIRAPFDGVVVKVEPKMGEWVEPGAPIARVIDLGTLRAEGFLTSQQATPDLVGRPVILQVTLNGKTSSVSGEVTFVSPEEDPVLHQVRFWAEFDNSAMLIRPGMTASLTIAAEK